MCGPGRGAQLTTDMALTYNGWLVTLSYLIAVVASFTALELGSRVTLSARRAARVWLIGGAFAMGIGIWSMHFVGMLAFHFGVPLAYDVPTTLVSLLPAAASSALALAAIRRGNAGWRAVTLSAAPMGCGNRCHALHRHGGNANGAAHQYD